MAEPSRELIDRIVREVLAALLHAGSGQEDEKAKHGAGEQGRKGEGEKGRAATDLVVRDRVVTLAGVQDRLGGVRRLLVPPRAVVTPAVRDELQRRNIALEFARAESAPAASSTSVRLVTMGSKYDPAPLTRALEHDGIGVRMEQMKCLIAATDKLAGELAAGTSAAVLVTAHPAAAMCLANRHAGVRAILAVKVETVGAEADAVGANLLVVDPTVHGLFAIKRMTALLVRGAPRPCPELFRKQLG